MTSVFLAIVGSTQFAKDRAAAVKASLVIEEAILRLNPICIISGGAEGIDSMAAAAANVHGITLREHLPNHHRWGPDGYKARNLLIAKDCTHLLRISHPLSRTYGSGWTADRAEEMGKQVERRVVPPAASLPERRDLE